MLETLMLSIASFIGTNIDDMIINTFFFSFANGKNQIRSIVFGKYLGIGSLILVSIIGSMGLKGMPLEYVKYFGFVPIGLGVKEFIVGYKERKQESGQISQVNPTNLLQNVAVITMANGADNIGVYTPLFTRFSGIQYLLFILVFMFMTAVWCTIGYKVSKVSVYENLIKKYKRSIVPLVYVLLGVYILI